MKKTNIVKMAQLAVLAAIIIVMAFTPLGYLKINPALTITFMSIPVCLGAMLLGVKGGTALGLLFGLTSFYQCFGLDPFGATLLGMNPFFTFIVCVVPRILVGLIAALTFKGMIKMKGKAKQAAYPLCFFAGSAANTILFISALWLFFGKTQELVNITGSTSIITFFVAMAGINALVEIPVCTVIGGIVSKVVDSVINRNGRKGGAI